MVKLLISYSNGGEYRFGLFGYRILGNVVDGEIVWDWDGNKFSGCFGECVLILYFVGVWGEKIIWID